MHYRGLASETPGTRNAMTAFFTRSTLALLFVIAVGCSTTPEKITLEEASGTGSEFDDGSSTASTGRSGATTDRLKPVYFDYDRFTIRDDAKPQLKANAQLISDKGWSRVTIEGYCDERGSDEYNIALGERRATRVKRYLIDLGVPASRLGTVSFGEARPAVSGHDESAWRMNRRSEFMVGSR